MSAKFFLTIMFIFFQTHGIFGQNVWNPQRTWVYFVGLVEFQDKANFDSFPQENRRDVELLDLLKKRGVPSNQIVYLQDKKATTGAIRQSFPQFLSRAQTGDWVFVYYSGHGFKSDDMKETFLAGYDSSDKISGWNMRSIPDTIDKYFKGSNALIALDDCYSGEMTKIIKKGNRRVSYGVFSSSSASSLSTGEWTFTESLINGFDGKKFVDLNHDGAITLDELARDTEDDMLFAEEQVATFAFTGNFDRQTVIASADTNVTPRLGERVEAHSEDDWYRAAIIDARGAKFKVHYFNYNNSDDEWVTAKQIRQFKPKQFPVGASVEVESEDEWYPAKILAVRGGSHYITYDDYDGVYNEWVSSDRVRKIK